MMYFLEQVLNAFSNLYCFWPPPLNHITIKRRVTKIAVKTDVIIPRPSVIEKPRTGPEPITNNITAAIKVVIFASKIADIAFS